MMTICQGEISEVQVLLYKHKSGSWLTIIRTPQFSTDKYTKDYFNQVSFDKDTM